MHRTKNSREIDFLIRIARGEKPELDEIDEKDLFRLAKFHRFIDLLAIQTWLLSDNHLSDKFKELLLAEYRNNTAQDMALRQGFYSLCKLLKKHKIQFILVKGIYLSDFIFPANERRQYADHDFLVQEMDFVRLEKLLLKHGFNKFSCFNNRFEVEVCANAGISRSYYHNKAQYLQADIHAKLSIAPGGKFLKSADCWSNPLEVESRGIKYQTLAPEVGLLHLCWHTLKHPFVRLLWFRDLWFYINSDNFTLNFDIFCGLVSKYRVEKTVVTALKLTAEIFQDERLKKKVNNMFPHFKAVECGFFAIPDVFQPRSEISARMRIKRDLSLIYGFSDKIHYLFNSFFPHPRLVLELQPQVSRRLDLRYLAERMRTLIPALSDKEDFKG